MRVNLVVVGRLRAGPEKTLVDDYLSRFEKTGRNLGLGPVSITEIDAKKGGMTGEADLIRRALPKGCKVFALDERGKVVSSPDFAQQIAQARDEGTSELCIIIGGADGLLPALRAEADTVVSFGSMVWPHMLARVMLAEQLYRASSILAGGPYHRI